MKTIYKDYLEKIKGKVKNAYVIGGEMVISNEMADTISNTLGVTAKRSTRKSKAAKAKQSARSAVVFLKNQTLCK